MKQHFVVKTHAAHILSSEVRSAIFWQDFIHDKHAPTTSFHPSFDRLFSEYGLSFWVTREYRPHSTDWDADERLSGLDRTFRIILQEDRDAPAALERQIDQLPIIEEIRTIGVASAELPVAVSRSMAVMPDVRELIYLSYARALTRGLPQIKVAVLDTGVNLNHPELSGRIGRGYDFVNLDGLDTTEFIGDTMDYDAIAEDEVGHGTHVAGIIAAKGLRMNEGVAPDCTIMPVRVLAAMKNGDKVVGAGIVDNINTGIKWAVDNGADVINMSLGIRHSGGGLPHADVIRYALSKNVTIVAASGNDGTSEKYYPGALPGVIAVGAVDHTGIVTPFTSYGANITVVAPGLNIYSSYKSNSYAYATGTSQASPFVSGSIALLKSYAKEHGRTLSNGEISYILKATSDKINSRLRDSRAGYGLINLCDSFKLLQEILN